MLGHIGAGCFGAEERAGQVGVDHILNRSRIALKEIALSCTGAAASVVDQDVNPAEYFDNLGHQSLAAGILALIQFHAHYSDSGFF